MTAGTSVVESAITLINGIAAQLEAAKNDPAAIQALADSLKAEDDKLATGHGITHYAALPAGMHHQRAAAAQPEVRTAGAGTGR